MNRSILIVICDFLLVSLLVFSSPDVNRITDADTTPALKTELATNDNSGDKDVAAALKMALDEDKKGRERLQTELAQARQSSAAQQAELAQRLSDTEKQAAAYQSQLQVREQEAQQYQARQAQLEEQYNAAQTNIHSLSQQLQNASSDSLISKEKLAALEDEIRKQSNQADSLQKHLADLDRSNQAILAERQQLATQLQVTEAEQRAAAAQAAEAKQEVQAQLQENEKLAENVKTLATQSGALVKEVHDNRELAPNTIFSDLVTNRVNASFTATRSSLFGASVHHKDTETILVTDGSSTFALCHLQDTPLTFFNPGIDWQALNGSLSGRDAVLPIHSLEFQRVDPRVVMIPVTQAEARQLGRKVYRISTDPFKFQDAVLVGARDGYYGECRFEIDLTTQQYVKLDRSFLKGLFGKFNPSSGDLVFSRNGEVLGIMVNGTYCLMLQDLSAAATFEFGNDVRDQHTGNTLAQLYARVMGMPFKLQ